VPKHKELPLHVPYLRAVKALTFAGKSLEEIKRHLRSLWLVPPKGNTLFRWHRIFQNRAKRIRKDLLFTKQQRRDEDIDPLFSYYVALGRKKLSPRCLVVQEIIEGLKNPILRRTVDVMLYIEPYDLGPIVDMLHNHISVPVTKFTLEQIEIYRDFFWDTDRKVMTDKCWRKYAEWAKGKDYDKTRKALRYITRLPYSSEAELRMLGCLPTETQYDAVQNQLLGKTITDALDFIAGMTTASATIESTKALQGIQKLVANIKEATQKSAEAISALDMERIAAVHLDLEGQHAQHIFDPSSFLDHPIEDIGDPEDTEQMESILEEED
jgi:hypothetical protein